MLPETELKILELYKNKPISKAIYALELMEKYTRQKELQSRIQLNGLSIGS